jgi:gamma-glutamylcyclotransferase (GGCT)/AIG2-like uncharacterized protein YtfP
VSKQLLHKLDQISELLKEQNVKLDKITGLMAGNQLLTECVDYQGKARGSEECAEIVLEAFSASLCLMSELDQRNREYQYQKQEFFLETEDDEEKPGPNGMTGIF